MILLARDRRIVFPRRPLIMGIVNINDDSFCNDGTLDPAVALAQAAALIRDGADIIDVGAESARTNRPSISTDDEIRRLTPIIQSFPRLVAEFQDPPFDNEQLWPPLLSINTWRPEVATAALNLGGDLLNDIGALPTPANATACAQTGAALVIMHTVGEPKIPHTHVSYPDVMRALNEFFDEKIALAESAGLDRSRIIIDPGIDFAKQCDANLMIYRHAGQLLRWRCPVLLPVSRKTVIGEVLGLSNPLDRDAGTVACLAAGMNQGAQIFRVHNVRAAAQAIKTLWALKSHA